MELSNLLNYIDGADEIKIIGYNDRRTFYEGKKFDVNTEKLRDLSVVVIYATCECRLIVEVV